MNGNRKKRSLARCTGNLAVEEPDLAEMGSDC